MKTLNRTKQKKACAQAVTQRDWKNLCKKALDAAESVKDRRALGLKTALEKGTEKKTLQTMNIICDIDISREFSNHKT